MNASIWAYLIPIILLTLSPGVDTLLVIRNTHRGGWRDGMLSSLGICSGLFVHATVSAVGISVVLLQSAWAFSALKLVGAAYLVWLGLSSLRNATRKKYAALPKAITGEAAFRPQRSLAEGLLSNVLNPKTVVFYMAFLPQFIDPAEAALQQSLFLAGLHFMIGMVWLCLLAIMVNRLRIWLERDRVRRALDATTGSLMILLGAKLALERG